MIFTSSPPRRYRGAEEALSEIFELATGKG
jgi:hypothetical protein